MRARHFGERVSSTEMTYTRANDTEVMHHVRQNQVCQETVMICSADEPLGARMRINCS